jgi:hypothetical protein
LLILVQQWASPDAAQKLISPPSPFCHAVQEDSKKLQLYNKLPIISDNIQHPSIIIITGHIFGNNSSSSSRANPSHYM